MSFQQSYDQNESTKNASSPEPHTHENADKDKGGSSSAAEEVEYSRSATSDRLDYLSIDWAFLRKPIIPPTEEFSPVEKFVNEAILSRHEHVNANVNVNDGDGDGDGDKIPENKKSNQESVAAAAGYRAILDLLRKLDDLPMLKKVFLALRTSGLEKISSERSKHPRLIHYIFRLNPFEDSRQERDVNENISSSQRISPVVEDYTLADSYLNFIVALTSANSVFLTPTLNTLWKLITQNDPVTPDDLTRFKSTSTSTSASTSQDEKSNEEENNAEEIQLQRKLEINSRLHGALMKVLNLVPKGKYDIFAVMASSFPFKLAPITKQVNYVKQCLLVIRYTPNIHREFIALCVDKCLEIDVEIRIAKNGTVKIEEKTKNEDNSDDINFDENKIPANNNESILSDLEIEKQEDVIKKNATNQENESLKKHTEKTEEEKVDEMAETLDTLMYLVFEHLQIVERHKVKTSRQLYKMIMPTFESIILTTHRSKFVQFIIVFICGLDTTSATVTDTGTGVNDSNSAGDDNDDNLDGVGLQQPNLFRVFAAKLIDIVLDPYRATVTRQSAVCYLASFVSRVAYVCPETACEAIAALLRFAEAYMDAFPNERLARNARRYSGGGEDKVSLHSLFYTVSQAAFYIMCFRGKECIDYYKKAKDYYNTLRSPEDEKISHPNDDDDQYHLYIDPKLIDISSSRWDRLCAHHLNPLKFCLESVRGEFLLLSENFSLMDIQLLTKLIIEDRKMSSILGTKSTKQRKKRRISIQTAATLERRRRVGGVGGLGKGSNPLDSFFPFDPYLLRRSHVFVDPYYTHWNGSASAEYDIPQKKDEDDKIVDDVDVLIDIQEDEDQISVDSDDVDESDVDDVDEEYTNEEDEEERGTTPMSLTSTSCSMVGSEWTDDLTDDNEMSIIDSNVPKETWMNELKRARALSINDDCW